MAATGPLPPRLAALAAHIASFPTATEALRDWCAARLPGPPAPVLAEVLHDRPADPAAYAGPLALQPAEPLRHRAVRLHWNGIVLSQAENWYLPDRLPAAIRAVLLTGDVPFGALIRPFAPARRPLPSPPGRATLRLRAIVTIAGAGDIAEVDERYARVLTDAALAVPADQRARENTK